MNVEIVTDSTSDLPPSVAREHNIDIIPAVVSFGDTRTYKDGEDITPSQFLELLQDHSLPHPTTGAPSLGEYGLVYKRHHDNCIISIHVGSKFSGIHDAAVAAARDIDPEKISVFNSGTVSLALGFLALQASEWSEQGISADDIREKLEQIKKRTVMYASLDTLEYAKRGGRISHLTALTGSMLNLKPVLRISNNVIESEAALIRKRSESLQKLVEIAQKSSPLEMVGVVHAGAETEAQDLADKISTFFQGTILFGEVGPALTAHAGPKTVGLALIRSEKEK